MPLQSPKVPFSQMNLQQSSQYARSVPVKPDPDSTGSEQIKDGSITEPKHASGGVSTRALADKSVANSKLRDSNALSVIGRSTNTNGSPADIALDADGKFVVRRGSQIVGDTIQDADIPAAIARDTEVIAAANAAQAAAEATAASALSAHVAASDPHPVYLTQTEGDARYPILSNILNASTTYDPPSLGDGAGTTTTVTVTGAALGDFALASFSLDLQGISVTAYVSSANTVSVRFQNESGGTLDLSSGTLKARVWK